MSQWFDWETTTIQKVKEISDDVEKDPWKYLHVRKDDSIKHIRRMYRMLARKYHPDLIGYLQRGDRRLCYERMIQINKAYEAIQRFIGKKSKWETAQYEWRKDFFDFDRYGKEVIDIESFEGEIAKYKDDKLPFKGTFFHFHGTPHINFGVPDEPFETGFGQSLNLYQLFVHLARKQGISVAPVVVKPFLEFHKLDEIDPKKFADAITSTPISEKGLRNIIKDFGIGGVLKSRKFEQKDFIYDLSRLIDITQYWNETNNEFDKSFIYGAGIREDGGLEIFHGWERVDIAHFTKNDFELMIRLAYGNNLLTYQKDKEDAATYVITEFGIEKARKDAADTFYEQGRREWKRYEKRRKKMF